MGNSKSLILFRTFFLISSVACAVWLLLFPKFPRAAYALLSGITFLHLLVGSEYPAFLAVAVSAVIPVFARLSALTVAPILGISQEIVQLFVFFCLGFSFAYPVIKWHITLPGLRHSLTALLFISLSIGVGVALAFVSGKPLTLAMDSPLLKIAFLAYVTVAEELTFRGAMLGRSVGILPPVLAAVTVSVLYGTLYIGYSPGVIALTVFASLLASKLFYLSQRLWPSMLFTFVWKLTSVLLFSIR